jgi:hypothetical protein
MAFTTHGPTFWSRTKKAYSSFKENETMQKLSHFLPEWNFITLHYTYFIFTVLLTSLIFYGTSNPRYSITYTDSLFLTVSAMTEAGLNTVNLSQMTTFQQALLFLLIFIGSSIFVSIATVHARKRVFEHKFRDLVKRQRDSRRLRRRSLSASRPFSRRSMTGDRDTTIETRLEERKPVEPVEGHEFESRHSGPRDPTPGGKENAVPGPPQEPLQGEKGDIPESSDSSGTAVPDHQQEKEKDDGIVDEGVQRRGRQSSQQSIDSRHIRHAPSPRPELSNHNRILSFSNSNNAKPTTSAYQQFPRSENGLTSRHPFGMSTKSERALENQAIERGAELIHSMYPTYLTRHTTGRNAQFFGLSRAEREHLGGVEYRAISLLAWIVPIYFVLWQLFGCVGLGWYFANNKASTARENGIDPWYVVLCWVNEGILMCW